MENPLTPRRFSTSVARALKLAGVCGGVGALALWLLISLTSGPGVSMLGQYGPSYSSVESFFLGVDQGRVDEVRIRYGGGKGHQLRKAESGWEILDGVRWLPLNPDRASTLLGPPDSREHPKADVTGVLQGSNPANHDRAFGVTQRNGIHVSYLSRGAVVEEFIVGRPVRQTAGWGTYIRRPDSNAVYVVPGNWTDGLSGESIHTWRRRFLFPGLDSADVLEIAVRAVGNQADYILARSDESASGWFVTTGGKSSIAEAPIAEAISEWVARLRTADFLQGEGAPSAGDQVADVVIRLRGITDPVQLTAYRDVAGSSILRLEVASPHEKMQEVLGVFDLMPLRRDPAELISAITPDQGAAVAERTNSKEPFPMGAGEKF